MIGSSPSRLAFSYLLYQDGEQKLSYVYFAWTDFKFNSMSAAVVTLIHHLSTCIIQVCFLPQIQLFLLLTAILIRSTAKTKQEIFFKIAPGAFICARVKYRNSSLRSFGRAGQRACSLSYCPVLLKVIRRNKCVYCSCILSFKLKFTNLY